MEQLYPGRAYYALRMVAEQMVDCTNFSPIAGRGTENNIFMFENCAAFVERPARILLVVQGVEEEPYTSVLLLAARVVAFYM
ncbi:hypothetical protein WN944_021971 [Citrus x changshan-huyou]|uniref:Uncharacterized protein n=1 Tax=Citrus x changshan-huyou TaxID=2935761 RepID=A0AAP0N3R8_9ROSI